MSGAAERADAVIVGARCAGSATATALARAGRTVVCLERATFPADTLSTHLLFLGGVVELQRLGALERVLALGPPPLHEASMAWGRYEIRTGYTPVDGLDYALCVRRPGLDAALAATAAQGGRGDPRGLPGARLVWERGRMAGVRYRDADGVEREIHAPLVIGADGRRSLIAREAGRGRQRRACTARTVAAAISPTGATGGRSCARAPRSGATAASSLPPSRATTGSCSCS